MGRTGWQVESVAVPMQHGGERPVHVTKRRSASGVGQRERCPAEFSPACWIDPGAERPRNQLRAKADAKRRQTRRNSLFDHRQKRQECRVARIVAGTDRAAQDDHQRRCDRVRRLNTAQADIEVANRPPALAQHQFQTAQIFEVDMANRQNFVNHRQIPSSVGQKDTAPDSARPIRQARI